MPSHVVTAKVDEYPAELQPYAEQLRHRSMLCRRLDMVQVECVVRGYLTGSGLKDYQRTGAVSGHELPAGLRGRLEAAGDDLHPVDQGADRRARREHQPGRGGATRIGADLARRAGAADARDLRAGRRAWRPRTACIVADTKFEFGHDTNGVLRLGDEVLTPDSSRFWPADQLAAGQSAAVVRQAVRPRLAVRHRLGQEPAGPRAAGRDRRADPVALRRGVRAAHGLAASTTT